MKSPMELTQDKPNPSDNQVDRYDPESGTIFIKGKPFQHSVILTTHTIEPWAPSSITTLKPEDFLPILEKKPEIILLGTGPNQLFPPDEILAPCIRANIAVDIMDTGAACRTFNLLVAEARNVIAGLFVTTP